MKKEGVGEDYVFAQITLDVYKKGASQLEGRGYYRIDNKPDNATSVNPVMQWLDYTGGYDVYMTETSTSEGYKKHPKFKAFTYYPNKEGLEKFQDVSEYITIVHSMEEDKMTFTITLRNEPEDQEPPHAAL